MRPFRIIFSDNKVLTCAEVSGKSKLDGNSYFEHDGDRMIFAVVNAENSETAQQIGLELVKQLEATPLSSF